MAAEVQAEGAVVGAPTAVERQLQGKGERVEAEAKEVAAEALAEGVVERASWQCQWRRCRSQTGR